MTKKERREREALQRRLEDMTRGIAGHVPVDDATAGLAYGIGIEEWLTWVQAVRRTWSAPTDEDRATGQVPAYCFELYNLHYLAETIEESADWLYEHGGRAEVAESEAES